MAQFRRSLPKVRSRIRQNAGVPAATRVLANAATSCASFFAMLWLGTPALVSAQTIPAPPVPVTPSPEPPLGPQPVLPGAVPVPGPSAPPAPPIWPPGDWGPRPGDRPQRDRFPPPGWFGAFEIAVVVPDVSNRLIAPVTVAGVTRPVQLPSADLSWTGSPRFDLGYRLPDGLGEFVATYRAVVSEGSDSIPGFDPLSSAFLRSRLNVNVFDLAYSTGPIDFAPLWDVSWHLGVRVAGIFFDSRATGLLVQERVSNNFVGAGPLGGVELSRSAELIPGLALFGRLESALVIGGVSQSFEETIRVGGTTFLGGATRIHGTEAAPVLSFQAGLSYSPPTQERWVRFAFGYQIEQWWGIGDAGSSRGDLTIQGVFFRTVFNF